MESGHGGKQILTKTEAVTKCGFLGHFVTAFLRYRFECIGLSYYYDIVKKERVYDTNSFGKSLF